MRYALELTDTEFDLRKIKDKLPTSLTELSEEERLYEFEHSYTFDKVKTDFGAFDVISYWASDIHAENLSYNGYGGYYNIEITNNNGDEIVMFSCGSDDFKTLTSSDSTSFEQYLKRMQVFYQMFLDQI